MEALIRILHLEDDPVDAELVGAKLAEAGLGCRISRAQTRDEFDAALRAGGMDIILADYRLPTYDGMSALRLLQDLRLDIPFIVVSGTMGEDAAIEALTQGATDYVLKQNLSRLAAAVQRALQEAQNRRERRQAEEALHRSNEELRRSEERATLLNRIADVFLTSPDGDMFGAVLDIVLDALQSRFGLFGYISEAGALVLPSMTRGIFEHCQVTNKSITFPPESWGNSLWGRAIREQRSFRSDGPFHIPTGHLDVTSFLAVPILFGGGTIGLLSFGNREGGYTSEEQKRVEDIAAFVAPILNARLQRDSEGRHRQAAEDALRASERNYRLLVANAGEGILSVQDGLVQFANPKALELLGGSEEQIVGTRFDGFIHPDDLSTAQAHHLVPTVSDDAQTLEACPAKTVPGIRIVSRTGAVRWVRPTAAATIWEGRDATLCFLRDVTEEVSLEAQFRHAQKMEAVGRLAGGIAHDFNNILGAIVGNAELLLADIQEQPGAQDCSESLDSILNACGRARDLVRQILTFSRRQEQQRAPCELGPIVSEVAKLLRASLPANIEIVQRAAGGVPRVLADPTQVHQVLMNLATNAAHAMSGKSGQLRIELSPFDGDAGLADHGLRPGSYARLRMADTGSGIPAEVLPRIFDPFFTTKSHVEGTGLGLAVVHGIVASHDGVIKVASTPGQGTTFDIYFPAFTAEGPTTRSIDASIPVGHGEHVIFVDDERALVDVGSRLLRRLGYRVTVFLQADDALTALARAPGVFDLVISDWTMPKMTGLEFAFAVRQVAPAMPFILATGNVSALDVSGLVPDEVDSLLEKPYAIAELGRAVAAVLATRARVGSGGTVRPGRLP